MKSFRKLWGAMVSPIYSIRWHHAQNWYRISIPWKERRIAWMFEWRFSLYSCLFWKWYFVNSTEVWITIDTIGKKSEGIGQSLQPTSNKNCSSLATVWMTPKDAKQLHMLPKILQWTITPKLINEETKGFSDQDRRFQKWPWKRWISFLIIVRCVRLRGSAWKVGSCPVSRGGLLIWDNTKENHGMLNQLWEMPFKISIL